MEALGISLVCTIVGTAITVGTVIWTNGRSAGKAQEWMKGHELLDATRFGSMDENIKTIQDDIKELLKRR